MTRDFAAAVADTLLPGEAAPPAGETALPCASAAGITIDAEAHRGALEAIAMAGGGEAAFLAAPEPGRTAILQMAERTEPGAFRALVQALLADYYESDCVLDILGWTRDPPQPRGHAVSPFGEASLASVRRRGRRWREVPNGSAAKRVERRQDSSE